MSTFERESAALRGRVRMMVGRVTIEAVNDDPMAQELQVQGFDGEIHDEVERFGDYGFTSVPLPGAEAITAAVGGLRSHQTVVGIVDRRHRPRGLKPGEVAMYDDQGQKVILTREGIEIHTTKPLKVFADSVTVESDSIDLGGEGGQPVARVGDTVAGGVITSGSSKVRAG